jgi:rhodanese-related sulfurtransferase
MVIYFYIWEVLMKKLLAMMVMVGFLATTLVISSSTAPAQEIARIKADELKKMIESKADIVIVDTQPKGAYDIGHIKGAINFPWAKDIKDPKKLPKNKLLVLYCDCGHEEDSIDVATQLMNKWGYSNIKILEGGWSGWMKLSYPTEKTKKK